MPDTPTHDKGAAECEVSRPVSEAPAGGEGGKAGVVEERKGGMSGLRGVLARPTSTSERDAGAGVARRGA